MFCSRSIRPLLALLLLLVLLPFHARQPTSVYAASQDIYTDALASNWVDYSWATVDFAATDPVHSGTHSIAVTLDAWGGLYLHHPGITTSGFTHVRFFIHGGTTGGQQLQLYAVRASDGEGQQGPSFSLDALTANTWNEVQVSLADLEAADTTLTGLVWQDRSGAALPVFFLDDLALASDDDPDAPILSHDTFLPAAAPADGTTTLSVQVQVTDPQGAADIAQVSLDASDLGRGTLVLHDDGRSTDGAANDGVYGAVFTIASATPPGEYTLLFTATDQDEHQGTLLSGALVVLTAPGGTVPAPLSQPIGWGTTEWSETAGEDWQVNSGLPWNYVYQYITYEWYQDGWGGDFVGRFVRQAWDKDFIPVISVYLMLATPPTCGESPECYAQKLQDPSAVQAYLTALEEAARQARGEHPVIFHLEPDFAGFMQQLSNSDNPPTGVLPDDPSSFPVALNITGYPNTLAGFGQRMVDLIHTTADNALVAHQASMWATNHEPNSVAASEATALATRTATFLNAMGGEDADLIFIEWSDRDAGSGLRPWWDDTNHTLPYHNRAILWANALSAASGKRLMLWQVPVGNTTLDNTCDHYQDNRVAYSFAHIRDLVDAGMIGVLYGSGATCMTIPSNDGGFLASQATIAYALPDAPHGLTAGSVDDLAVSLVWEEVSVIDLWGYEIHYRQEGSETWQTQRVGRTTTMTLTLPLSGTWQVEVATYDALGQVGTPTTAITVTADDGGGGGGSTAFTVYLPMITR